MPIRNERAEQRLIHDLGVNLRMAIGVETRLRGMAAVRFVDRLDHLSIDLMGNAQEWTANELEPYPDNPGSRDESFRRDFMGVRGGSYAMRGRGMGLYTRSAYLRDAQYGIGFRCARDSEEAAQEDEEAEGEEEASESEE